MLGAGAGYYHMGYQERSYTPSFKDLFDDFLASVKTSLAPPDYLTFIRYLSVYMTGKIPHDVFIRLFLRFFPRDHRLVQKLPTFLAGLQASSFSATDEEVDLGKTIQDKIAIEAIVNMTVDISSAAHSKSIGKCLLCLSTGLISPDLAKRWLLAWCKPDIIAKLEEISDFSYFHPSRFPHELILCPEFSSETQSESIRQKFLDHEVSKRTFSSFKPVKKELLLVKMRGLRVLISDLNNGKQVTALSLLGLYGDAAAEMKDCPVECSSVIISRAANFYNEAHEMLDQIYTHQREQLEPSNPEFRYIFRHQLSREFFGFKYMLPGERNIIMGTPRMVEIAAALVCDFIKLYFPQKESESLLSGFRAISAMFGTDDVFVVFDKPLYSVLYMSLLSNMIAESGDFDSVIVANESIQDNEQTSDYGRKLAALPGILKTRDTALADVFGNTIMQHVDLVLTRIVRMVNEFVAEETELTTLDDDWPGTVMLTTMKRAAEDGKIGFVCNTVFSPCYIETDTASDVSE